MPPQVTTSARKPLSIAFEEIGTDKISYDPIPPEELAKMETIGNFDPVVPVAEEKKSSSSADGDAAS